MSNNDLSDGASNGMNAKNISIGVLIDSYSSFSNPLTSNDQDLRIGGTGSYFRGNIDEVRIIGREESKDWNELPRGRAIEVSK